MERVSGTAQWLQVEKELAKKGIDIFVELAPKVTDYGRMPFPGRRFLILGPPRCGKSRLKNASQQT
jgi:hypothetical protein